MTAANLRHQFMREFRRLSPHTRALAGFTVAFYLLQTLAAIAAGWWLLQLELSALTAAGLGMLMLFIGTRLRASTTSCTSARIPRSAIRVKITFSGGAFAPPLFSVASASIAKNT